MKKLLLPFILIGIILFTGCTNNPDALKYIDYNTSKTPEKIDWWTISENYILGKEYSKGDIVKFEGEVNRMYWYGNSSNTYHINECSAKWTETKDFSMKNICDQLYFGGKVKIVGECYGTNNFFIKDCKIIEKYNVTLDSYISERSKMDVNGISKEEAQKLNKWCDENKECKIFEESLELSIYNLYPDL